MLKIAQKLKSKRNRHKKSKENGQNQTKTKVNQIIANSHIEQPDPANILKIWPILLKGGVEVGFGQCNIRKYMESSCVEIWMEVSYPISQCRYGSMRLILILIMMSSKIICLSMVFCLSCNFRRENLLFQIMYSLYELKSFTYI